MLRTDELNYELPDELIAIRPADRRDAARLMVLSRRTPGDVDHRAVRELPELLNPDDLLVLNNTRVLPARLLGRKKATGGRVEGLYLDAVDAKTWRLMLKSNGRLRPGDEIEFLRDASSPPSQAAAIRLIEQDEAGWTALLLNDESTEEVLARVGRTPLPPYILKARRHQGRSDVPDAEDRARYQTVYAGREAGAVAAPTAGLHFTDELLAACAARGVRRASITLHVGAGTFKPVETEYLEEHAMHAEWFTVPGETIQLMRETRRRGGRIVNVGTTTVRALESLDGLDQLDPDQSITDRTTLLIAPGFAFRHTDAMLTNFHLPRSTLLALVGAFLGDVERLKAAYREAIDQRYRFYSYGDAMLIRP